MYLTKLEPTSIEEFLFFKEQLSKYYPELEKLEWIPGEVLSQISKLTGIPKAKFEKEILSISRAAVNRNQKRTLMLYRLGMMYDADQLERMTGVPLRQFEREHLAKMTLAWFLSSATELIVHVLAFVAVFYIFHPMIANIVIGLYGVFMMVRIYRGHGSPISNRIVLFVLHIIGEGDKRWRV